MQINAYNDSLNLHRYETEYMAIIDLDEFIVPVKYKTIIEFLDNLESKLNQKIGSVGINWLMFGYNGHYTKQNGLITEIYKKCDFNYIANQHVKSIFNPKLVIDAFNPHFPIQKFGAKIVNANGDNMFGPFNPNIYLDEIRINHYWTKSYEEFCERLKKGKADGHISNFNEPYSPDFLSVEEDDAIKKFLPELKKRLNIL